MPVLDATVFTNRAYVLVQTDWLGMVLHDTFSRTLVNTWGSPDLGPAYVVSAGAAANFDVTGTQGTLSHTAVNTTNFITSPVAVVNVDFSGSFINTVVPAGDNFEISFFVRFVDLNNYIRAIVFLQPSGTVTCVIEQANAGVFTISAFNTIAVATTGVYGFRLVANGSSILFRFWNATGVEPSTWNNSYTATFLSAGGMGVGTKVNAASTVALPMVFFFDDLVASDPNAPNNQCATVTRRNTVTGEVITLRPYVYYDSEGNLILECGQGLWWDTEPPLGVPLEYCAVACDQQVAVTQTPGFEGGTTPWTATGGTLTQDCTVAKVGLCSGRLTPSGTNADIKITQTGFTLTPGVQATMSAWVRSSLGWNAVRLTLDIIYSDATVAHISTPVEILDDNEWRFLSVTFTPVTTVTSTTFSFVAIGTPTAGNLFNIDEIQITQPVAVTTTDCETVTVDSESFWLKNPLHPCLDVEVGICDPMLEDCDEDSRVSFASMPDETYVPNTVLLTPANRRRPIPVNRVRRDVEAVLRLIAHDCDARDAVLAINEPGDPLLWQAPAIYCTPDRYMSVTPEDDLKISVDHREPFRLMSLPHVAVDRPPGPSDGICGARITDLCDIYTTWAALGMAGLTWTDLLLGNASPSGPDQPVPPAAARTWDDVETEFADWDAVEAGGTRDWNELRDGL
jgi:hypothetical protein